MSDDADLFVGIDLGTSGPKVGVVTADGRIVSAARRPVSLHVTADGGAEQDPKEWWEAVCEATREAVAAAAVDPRRVRALCPSAQWGGTVAVDEEGEPLRPALIWMDSRGAEEARRIAGGGLTVPTTGYNARKLIHWIRLTGGVPSRTGKDPVGQIAWLRENEPEVHRNARWFLDVPEYLTLRCCGAAVAGWDTAVLRWCADTRDASDVHYDRDLARAAGLDIGRLPRLVSPSSVVGPLTAEAADGLGLTRDTVVVVGTGDTLASAIGAGSTRDFDPFICIGTSAWVSCQVPFKKTDVFRTVASLPSVIPGRWWVATEQDVAGAAFAWLADRLFHISSDVAPPGAEASGVFAVLESWASAAPPGSGGVLFAPWLNGERTPVDDPDLRGCFVGLNLETDRSRLARSVYEGVALNTRWMFEAAERFACERRSREFSEVRLVGGASRSDLLAGLLATVLGRRVHRMARPDLANVRGAALVAAVATGVRRWSEIPDLVEIDTTFEPDADRRPVYDRLFALFKKLARTMRSPSRALAPLRTRSVRAEAR
ncbi:MAG: carbohydrate kinase [Acidimicrobiales bacterium]|nr:MAG: carbohydrate kinase [Acidimicrobiales bacterium]